MVVALSLASFSPIVAVAGLVLAVASFFSNRRAIHREQVDRTKAIEDAWTFEWAAQRPVVIVDEQHRMPIDVKGSLPA